MSNLVKKALLFFSIVFSCLFISNYALANDSSMMNSMHNGVNDVRNVVGGAENAVENGVKDATTSIKDGLEDMGNSTQNTTRDSEYSATRTSADDTTARAGITNVANNNNLWTWLIVGAVALIIIGIIWYMVARNNNGSNQ